jgi:pathogenesis-related protein 1
LEILRGKDYLEQYASCFTRGLQQRVSGGPFVQPIVKGNVKEKLMKIFFCIATAAAALAVPASAALTPAEQAAILTALNNERAKTGSPAVPALTWSTDLATYAQAWTQSLATRDQGLLHRDSSTNTADFTINNPFKPMEYLGENIFGSSSADDGTLGAAAAAAWISEKAFYNFAADDGNGSIGNPPGCTAPQGSACGHYTQVVWRATTLVGCGKATSASGWTFVVCNFYSAGNFTGMKPY